MARESFPGSSRDRNFREKEEREILGKKTYQTEAGPVEVEWLEVRPANGEVVSEKETSPKATLFLPGWAMTPERDSLRQLSQSFADYAENPTYIISTRAVEHSKGGMLYQEADAIRQFIEEKRLSDLVVSGHSQGGDKAIDLVSMLQENPGVKVEGLVLIDSVGLYEQGNIELAAKFTKTSLLDTPRGAFKYLGSKSSFLKRSMQAGTDVIFGIAREVGKSKRSYLARLLSEIKNMATLNRRIEQIKIPVVLVQGSQDSISDPKRIAPVEGPSERESYLKENLFKSSPYVRMIVAEKAGHHGLPLFRSESVARASLYMLKRFHRSRTE